jgi:hypothetical protein
MRALEKEKMSKPLKRKIKPRRGLKRERRPHDERG